MKRIREYTLRGSVIGLTLISVLAGFAFYSALFGMATAILCCVIFETIRLACLWSFHVYAKLSRVAVVLVYLVAAATCALVGITSFHARIIASHDEALQPQQAVIEENLALVRKARARQSQETFAVLNDKIDLCQRKLAWSPDSKYWRNRHKQLKTERQRLLAERDSLLAVTPGIEASQWLKEQAALFDVQLKPLPETKGHATAVTQAIEELWGLSEIRAKKVVSIIIVMAVEVAIILLSLLIEARGDRTEKTSPSPNSVLSKLQQHYDDRHIHRFLKKCHSHWTKRGKLPVTSDLGRAQREMRKILVENNVDQTHINQLLAEL